MKQKKHYLIMGYNYINFEEVVSYGVSKDTILYGCNRFRQGKTKSWANKKDPIDKRKVLIDLDSIPEPTRTKYNIPTGIEYFEQQELKAKIEHQKQKERELNLQTNIEKRSLMDAYNNNWLQYLSIYRKMYVHNAVKCEEHAQLSAREHAFWLAMIDVTGNMHRGTFGKAEDGFRYMNELRSELIFTNHINSIVVFRRKLKDIRTELVNGRCPSIIIGNLKKLPRPETKKTNEFHKSMALLYVGHPKKYAYRVCTDLINHVCIQEKQPLITESWLKQLMAYNNAFRTMVIKSRNGEKFTNDNLLAHAVRNPVPYPANLWMIDGTPIQFYCWNKNRTKQIRLNLFVIIDVHSRKIVGFDIALSEDKFTVMEALKNAVKIEGHLPAEILSDNFSANKTEEIKTMQAEMLKLGTHWRFAKVGNPQDKSFVERFFGSFQSIECDLYDDYFGDGIASRNRHARAGREYLEKIFKERGLLSFDEMTSRVINMVVKYNERTDTNGESPLKLYQLPKPNAVEMDGFKTALLFWNRTKHTVSRGMVKITVNKEVHAYEIYSNKLKAELQNKTVYVRYDVNDLDKVMLFDTINEYAICECRKSLKINTATVDRTEEDVLNTNKHVAKNKSYLKYLDDTAKEIHKAGMKIIGKSEIELPHPLQLTKNQITERESLETLEYYHSIKSITTDNEQKPRTKPLGYLTDDGEVKTKNSYAKNVEEKASDRGSFKPV